MNKALQLILLSLALLAAAVRASETEGTYFLFSIQVYTAEECNDPFFPTSLQAQDSMRYVCAWKKENKQHKTAINYVVSPHL